MIAEQETRNRKINREKNIKLRIQFLSLIAECLVDGNVNGALEEFNKNKRFAKEFKKLHDSLNAVSDRTSLIIDSFKPEIGKEIELEIDGEEKSFIVRELKDNKVYVDSEYGRGFMVRTSFAIKDLTYKERIRRLAEADKTAAAIYGGILAVKMREYREARSYFREAGPLSEYLLKLVRQRDKESSVFDEGEFHFQGVR
jgi:hypothetical protein